MSTTTARPGQQQAPEPGNRRSLAGAAAAGALGLALLAVVVLGRVWARSTPDGLVLSGSRAWLVTGATTALALVLLIVALVRRTSWHYPEDSERDLRLDWVRGLAIVFVVLNHINIPSLFQLVTQETIGPVSGAELFVALSGVVLGIVYRQRSRRLDMVGVTGLLWSRAFKLYRTALVVVLGAFVLTLVPAVNGSVITTFTAQSTS